MIAVEVCNMDKINRGKKYVNYIVFQLNYSAEMQSDAVK